MSIVTTVYLYIQYTVANEKCDSHVCLLKVHKIENFFGSDLEFCIISLLVMLKY